MLIMTHPATQTWLAGFHFLEQWYRVGTEWLACLTPPSWYGPAPKSPVHQRTERWSGKRWVTEQQKQIQEALESIWLAVQPSCFFGDPPGYASGIASTVPGKGLELPTKQLSQFHHDVGSQTHAAPNQVSLKNQSQVSTARKSPKWKSA